MKIKQCCTFVLGILLLATIACKPQKKTADSKKVATALTLINTSWIALDVRQSSETADKANAYDQTFTLTFDDETRLSLQLDKNKCHNQYTRKDNKITIDAPFGCTKMCCDAREGKELTTLLQTDKEWTASLEATNLVLTSANYIVRWKPIVTDKK